jgi:hypothetical protein
MKLKEVLDIMTEQAPATATPATQSTNVKGVPKVMLPIVRRKVPAGYTADVRKWKKKKGKQVPIKEAEDPANAGDMYPQAMTQNKFVPSPQDNMSRTFDGDRPKYKPKKKFFLKKKKAKKVDEQTMEMPMQQRPAIWDFDYLARAFKGKRPTFKGKKQEITPEPKKKAKKPVDEQFMGPQIFNQDSPYKDLEFLTKFWKGSKNNKEITGPEEQEPEKKSKKAKKKKPQGTYQPDVQKNKVNPNWGMF